VSMRRLDAEIAGVFASAVGFDRTVAMLVWF
jgi:hypothetical protein